MRLTIFLATKTDTFCCQKIKFLQKRKPPNKHMLWTIAVILFILWIVGFITSATFGGWIHILLIVAIVVIVVQLLQGRKLL